MATYISIHAPLAGRDFLRDDHGMRITQFQSTRPLRGATDASPLRRGRAPYFNPRAPCGARRDKALVVPGLDEISIHAPLAGRDAAVITTPPRSPDFNPRAPCGARRDQIALDLGGQAISIHAPLAGRDSKSVQIALHIFAITDKF